MLMLAKDWEHTTPHPPDGTVCSLCRKPLHYWHDIITTVVDAANPDKPIGAHHACAMRVQPSSRNW